MEEERDKVVPDQELRVGAQTDVKTLATALVKYNEEGNRVTLSCIGVPSTLQAMKAVAAANGQVAPRGYFFSVIPTFHVTRFPDRETGQTVERTAMLFALFKHRMGG
jgi:stage V sporulation protein SpoVS